jgi:hypothetical protein
MKRRISIWYRSLGKCTIPTMLLLASLVLFIMVILFRKSLIMFIGLSYFGGIASYLMLIMAGLVGIIWILGDEYTPFPSGIIHGIFGKISGWTLLILVVYMIVTLTRNITRQ